MKTTSSVLVAGAFPKKEDAESAVKELGDAGFGDGSISLVYTDPGTVVTQGLLQGAAFGGVVGGLVGLLFPPIGVLVAAGPVLGTLASAISGAVGVGVAGMAVGGLASGLVSLGMPDEMAGRFGQHLQKGDTLVVAHTSTDDAPRARKILESHSPRESESSTGAAS